MIPQLVPSQVAVPCGSVGQAEHDDAPHELTLVFATQALTHQWYPESHVIPQLVPLQVAMPCGSVGHAEHDDAPHEPTLVFATQALLQKW